MPATILACLLRLPFTAVGAQEEAVARARTLQASREFAAAARLLESHLATFPDDRDAARLLGQTLYWMQDIERARVVYEAALARHPADESLRLEYGRMLVETGEQAAARAMLTPLRDRTSASAEANALLGTLAYWNGDLVTATRRFSEALAIDPSHSAADRQLSEIRDATAAWIRISPALWHDDQPITRTDVGVELGWFATALSPVRLRVQPMRFESDLSPAVWALDGDIRHFIPAARLETELGVGVLERPDVADTSREWTGRAVVGVRTPQHLTFRARTERAPYLHTASSLSANVMVRTREGGVHLDHPRGWLGQAAYQRQLYPDENTVRTVYGWLLAPLSRSRRADVQAGYSFGADHARESRSVLLQPVQRFPPGARAIQIRDGDTALSISAQYDPYYTPSHLVKHAAIGALTVKSNQATVRVGGSYAVHAREDAPVWVATPAGAERTFVRREFSPWDLRGSVDINASRTVTIALSGETGRAAFYRWTHAGLHITYRFLTPVRPAAP